jgi:hypothetical protein
MNWRIHRRIVIGWLLLATLGFALAFPSAFAADAPPATGPAAERPFADPGEKVLPADKAPQDAPLRARDSDTYFKLSNPRIERGPKPWPQLVVDYEKTHLGANNGQSLIVRTPDGRVQQILLIGPFAQKVGKIDIDLHIGGPRDPGPPKDAELYLTRSDMRHPWHPTFKVSNSAVLGTMKDTTFARDWKPDEAAKLAQPPPDYANPNAHPGVGRDTPFAGKNQGGVLSRFVSPGHPLLGVEYHEGEWDKEKCLARLVPIFSEDQPVTIEPRELAKEGYAVGGMNVKAGKFVYAVQLIYMKLKPDGTLDPKDTYTTEWLGPESTGKVIKLGGDGKRVIGINCRSGAILDGLALVMESSTKAAQPPAGAKR